MAFKAAGLEGALLLICKEKFGLSSPGIFKCKAVVSGRFGQSRYLIVDNGNDGVSFLKSLVSHCRIS